MRILPFGPETVFDVLTRHASEHPDAPFLIFEDVYGAASEISYAQMRARAAATAMEFALRGVTLGDRVHIHLRNCPEFYDCWFGAAAIGAAIVPTSPQSTVAELSHVVSHARCKISVGRPDAKEDLVRVQAADQVLLTSSDGPPSMPAARDGIGAAGDLPTVNPLATAAVLYTSGTTSRPKGVLITHANYLHAGNVVAQHLRLRPDDRWLVVLPLFHANAQYYSSMSALVTGASLALVERFSASRWARQAARHGATLASLFAAPIRMILAQPARSDDSANRLRAVIFSQNITEAQLHDFEQRFDAPLLQLYGMTETIAPPTLNPLYGARNNMSIGRPTPGARLRIVTDDGADAHVGETGELLVFGEPGTTLMSGYLDDPGSTSMAMADGWLHTGDKVRMERDAFIYFVDRDKDLIKRAGENIAAGEIETVANSHPAVFESAAVGVRDDIRDEAIKLFVVKREGLDLSEEMLLEFCAERLATFKVPSFIEFRDALPRTSVGKVKKEELR
jgi:carnitine-CoA ligase